MRGPEGEGGKPTRRVGGRSTAVGSLAAAGGGEGEDGERLGLSAHTVEFHRANLMAKLEVTNFNELAAIVRKRGWVRVMSALRDTTGLV